MATKTKLQAFLDQAYYWAVTNPAKESGGQNKFASGSELAKIFSLAGASAGTAWCAIFVYACAKKAGATGLISYNCYAPGICHNVIKKGGTWIKGPYTTKSKVVPKPGDLILYNSSTCHMKYKDDGSVKSWHGYHVGIVYEVTSTQVITMEGNVKGGRAKKVKHSLSSREIGGYARPNWGTAGNTKATTGSGNNTSGGSGVADVPLYKTKNDRHDMTLREIGYMNTKGSLTTSDTGVKIALINYTTVLGDLYDAFARNTYGGSIVDTSKLSGNEKIVVDYLLGQGFNGAGACGIAGNIKADSNYNPATVDGVECGICKWSGTTAGQMRASIGATTWISSLSGQLDFLIGDLLDTYPTLLKELKAVPNTTAGVKTATEKFAKTYRKITSTTSRVTTAQAIFSKILYKPAQQAGEAPNPKTTNKTCKVIDVTKKSQQALSVCYNWFEVGMADSEYINKWNSAGKSTNKGLCYLDSCYLVSYDTQYSLNVGNYVELVTSKGKTIPCIIAGGHNNKNTPILFYRPRGGSVSLKDWSSLTIKQIKNFGAVSK